MFTSIDQIRAHQFVGCHAFDSEAFSSIERFAESDNNPISDRAEALRIMATKGMGLTGHDAREGTPDSALVAEYMVHVREESFK